MVFCCTSGAYFVGCIENRAMKILVFTTQIHLLGGAEKLAIELVEGLNSQPGIRADLLVMGPEDESSAVTTKQRLLNNGVHSVKFLERPHGTGGRGMLWFIFKLRHIIQTGGYDFIETSMPGPTILACWATIGLQTQLVAGIHKIYHKTYQKKWSCKFLRLSVKINYRVQFYAISSQAKQSWIDYAQIEPERVQVIYNSITTEHFESERNGLNPEGIPDFNRSENKALYVGRLSKQKGLDTLINALGPILEHEKVHLFIVGWNNLGSDTFYPGDGDLLERLLEQIKSNAWEDRIHFLGFRSDIPEIMNFVDIMVHPARDEGFGLVLAEALAAGLPVVATNIGGIPETLSDTDSILVSPDDPAALRKAFLDILHRSPEEAALCRRKAQKRAEFFRPERRLADMIALFRDLCDLKAK